MAHAVQGSRATWLRCSVLLCSLLLTVHYATASGNDEVDVRLRVRRISNGSLSDEISLNPVAFFENTVAEFTCFCVNQSLGPLGGEVELLRNGFPLKSGSCDAIFHETTITSDYEGEYLCRVFFPNNETIQPVESEMRTLNVLDPDDIIAPPVQYAVNNSRHPLQCAVEGVEDGEVLVSWKRAGSDYEPGPYVIESVRLSDEGVYTCKVYFLNSDVSTTKDINLYVVVPPLITHPLPLTEHLTSNRPLAFVIKFRSRFENNTSVAWYRDSTHIQNGIETEFTSTYEGCTTLHLPEASHSDAGKYRVVVTNNFTSIPQSQRRVHSTGTLTVTVHPVLPTNVVAQNLSASRVQLTWQLSPAHSDETPNSISVLLTNMTDLTLTVSSLPGSSTSVIVDVVPGMWYRSVIKTVNDDGETSTRSMDFRAATAAPHVMKADGKRLNMTSFTISMSLLYVGGDDISHFLVSFQERNETEWIRVEAHAGSAEQGLYWYGTVTSHELAEPSELHVVIVNDAGHKSATHIIQEGIAPLSAPSTPTLLSASHDSLTLSFLLPQEGTPPILHIIVNFSSPSHFQWECKGVESKPMGAQLDCTIPRLSADTQYTLTVFGVGHAGRGNATSPISFSTTSLDTSLPVWVVVVVSVVAVMGVVVIFFAVLFLIVHKLQRKKSKRLYHFDTKKATGPTAPKPLDPSHAMLNRRPQKPSISTTSEIIPPLSPSSTLTPPPSRSTPSTTVTYKDETTSDSSCSNLDSEISEAQTPTYTYRMSSHPPPCPPTLRQQPYHHSLHRGVGIMAHTHSLHSTRESLASCPPVPHNSTNV